MKLSHIACSTLIAVILCGSPSHSANPEVVIVPQIVIPKTEMPMPNAYDYFTAAGRMLGSDVKRISSIYKLDDNGKLICTLSDAQRSAMLKKHAPALRTVRWGFKYGFCFPPKYGLDALLPECGQYRALSRLIVLQGQAAESSGDVTVAIDSYLDALRFSIAIADNGPLTAALCGMGSETNPRISMWEMKDKLNAKDARKAASEIESVFDQRSSLGGTLLFEKWSTLFLFDEMFRGKCSDKDLNECGKMPDRCKRRVIVEFSSLMDSLTVDLSKRYPLQNHTEDIKRSDDLRDVPADIVLSIFTPVYPLVLFNYAKCTTLGSLLEVALALQAHKLEKGRYPSTLDELTPSYLKNLPEDPFAVTGTLQYELNGDSYTLYSLGPDGKDDGGKPIINEGESGRDYRLSKDSKGDIVAGVHKY